MSANFNIAMVLKADVASARAGLKEVASGLKEVEGAADRTRSAVRQEASDLDALAMAAAKAAAKADQLAAAEKRRQAAQVLAVHGPAAPNGNAATDMTAWRTAETSAASLQAAVRQVTVSMGEQGHAAVDAAQAARAWQSALDDVRASFKGGILGGLISLGGQWLTSKLPAAPAGFASGGHTGGSDPSRVAGVVHEQEYVFSAPAVRRIGAGNLEALHRGSLRGFRSVGYVSAMPAGRGTGAGSAAGGGVTFAPSFDLRGATDPAETRRQAMRGMQEALKQYDDAMPRRLREIFRDSKAI